MKNLSRAAHTVRQFADDAESEIAIRDARIAAMAKQLQIAANRAKLNAARYLDLSDGAPTEEYYVASQVEEACAQAYLAVLLED